MKANEAPEIIHVQPNAHDRWFEGNIPNGLPNGLFVEYTRTDAFIEKALEFLDGCIFDYIDLEHANVDTFMNIDNKRFIEDFRNHMDDKK